MTTADRTGPDRRRGRGPSKKLDAAIAEATVRLVSRVGPARISIEGVAREAGCSKSSLYRRGLSRESLILESIATVWLVEEEPEHPFEAIVRTRAQSFRDRAYALAIVMLIDEALRGTELGKRYLSEAFGPLRQGRADHLASAMDLGEVRADVDADLLLDVVTGALLFRTAHHPGPEPDLADRLVALLRDGIKPKGGV